MSVELCGTGAERLAHLVSTGEVAAAEVIEAHLDGIARLNPAVNAVTNVLAGQARARAADIDRELARGHSPGPLAGVPVTVKENLDVAGSATTFGVPQLREYVPHSDAPPVRRLREAGAVPIARTNLPDLTIAGVRTVSQLYGRTYNPWDASRTPGGSSGGDAVAVATGMTPLGLGNDSGGSVRMPAVFCGVAGLKPSYGRFPADHRVGANEPTLASQLFPVDGPLARSVADLRAAYRVLAGADPRDPRAVQMPLTGQVPRRPVRVGVTTDPAGLGVHPDVRDAVEVAATALADAGYAVEEIELPRMEEALEAYGKLVITEFSLGWSAIRPLLTDESARHMELGMRRQPPVELAEYVGLPAIRHGIGRDWAELFARYPLVLGPTMTEPPFDADPGEVSSELYERENRAMRLCTASTFVGVPAVAVPTGLAGGLPQGVQVIGGMYREDLCLDAAEEIERRLGPLTPVSPAP